MHGILHLIQFFYDFLYNIIRKTVIYTSMQLLRKCIVYRRENYETPECAIIYYNLKLYLLVVGGGVDT